MPATPDPQRFAQLLRQRGVTVPVDSVISFTEALGILAPPAAGELYWAARSTLLVRREDQASFDAAFAEFLGLTDPGATRHPVAEMPVKPEPATLPDAEDPEREPEGSDEHMEADHVAWSRVEMLARRDLASCTPDELAELHSVVRGMRLATPAVPSRRRRLSRRGEPDLRRTIRASMRSGNEFVAPVRRDRGNTPQKLVLLVDVSGSMEPYARTMLRFAHAAVQSSRRVEVFCFATRLTRLTNQLRVTDPDSALERVTAAAEDMSGGTRLGEALSEFNDRWGIRGAARSAVVVVLSDGWDRGRRGLVDAEMARLSRVASRIVWVNPLKATAGYEPLAAGMAEAITHVDDFVEGHSVASLADLARLVARCGRTRTANGYGDRPMIGRSHEGGPLKEVR